MRNRKGIPKVALVSKPPRVVVLSYVSNRKLSIDCAPVDGSSNCI